jgi:hypothetical protein
MIFYIIKTVYFFDRKTRYFKKIIVPLLCYTDAGSVFSNLTTNSNQRLSWRDNGGSQSH